jgi:hypothetical protein
MFGSGEVLICTMYMYKLYIMHIIWSYGSGLMVDGSPFGDNYNVFFAKCQCMEDGDKWQKLAANLAGDKNCWASQWEGRGQE